MSKEMVCTECGYIGNPKKITKGNVLIEIILYLTFIIPGIIYSIWRLSNRVYTCPQCKNESMIPSDSPRGKEIKEKRE